MEEYDQKRAPKPTKKAVDDKISRLIGFRRGKLSQLTGMMKNIDNLKLDESNVDQVEEMLHDSFHKAYTEFEDVNAAVVALLDEDEGQSDQHNWYGPRIAPVKDFVENTENWCAAMRKKLTDKNNTNEVEGADDNLGGMISQDDIQAEDSVSQAAKSYRHSKKRSSVASSTTTGSSARIEEEAEHAALMARSAALEKKRALEMEKLQLKVKMEQLALDTAIAESEAKLKVFEDYEGSTHSNPSQKRTQQRLKEESNGAMLTSNAAAGGPAANASGLVSQPSPDTQPNEPCGNGHPQVANNERGLYEVMQKQNAITEMLVKQQTRSYLPSKDIPVFKGDPLTYKSFIRAFEHAVDSKADSYQDKLYYLEQYTSGEPQELVRSCEHMSADRGYHEARKLLQRQYGNELKIANAYMDKALRWPQIKSEDGKALSAYALFLIGCRNTMDDIEFMEEMDNPTNMPVVVSKLPYKIRDKWRTTAFEIRETGRGRARFSHLVHFIDRQAKVALDPLFGDVIESSQTIKTKEKATKERNGRKTGQRESTFATGVQDTTMEATAKKSSAVKGVVTAFHKPCLFCQKNHALSVCNRIKELTNIERINFLKSRGLCFGCLTFGHLSKNCKKRLRCQICSQLHPDILHIKTDDNNTSEKMEETNTENDIVSSAYVSLGQESCGNTGAGEEDCVLAVVPVKLKSRKSERYVETYAFIDPGSTATFCTEDIQRKLSLKGKSTQFLLDTMAQDNSDSHKLMKSVVLSDLEVCGLEESTYIELPKVFTHSHIPVKKENIPRQEDIAQWQYLKEVRLPCIKAGVGMLIGANVPKAIEPWHK